ncbi:C-type lectin and transmembrane domain-containing protein FLJ45910 [Pteropus alecto]|uniref:C-type lectin and transmembrane domain-containing protein FLJ45910 n=1 Tax=Pteropus alecto TaxID=9402 RepID=L5K4X1_PTEAL|nr:C-type lectin and transmembrane domain-containing protein FLJ45910 [Pteropus alecto]
MHTLFTDSAWQDLPGTREERDDDDDYENMAPSYKDLPPKPACARHHDGGSSHAFALPLKVSQSSGKSILGMTSGSVAPPRPPKQGKKTENPRRPCKPLKITGLDLTPVNCTSQQVFQQLLNKHFSPSLSGISLEHPPCQPSQATTPVPWLSQKSWGSECYQKERLMFSLVVVSLLLSCTGLAVTLIKYQKVVEELRILTFQQVAWQANGLAGLKKDIDRIRADTNQSLVELRGLLDCTRVTCPEGWLLFEGKCYYFSTSTKSWDEARKFCQENYSHLVIISSIAEQGTHVQVLDIAGCPPIQPPPAALGGFSSEMSHFAYTLESALQEPQLDAQYRPLPEALLFPFWVSYALKSRLNFTGLM